MFSPFTGANVIRTCRKLASKFVTQKSPSKPTKYIEIEKKKLGQTPSFE